MPPPPTHYETLGISRSASIDEIKTKFRQLAHETHPDTAGDAAKSADRFKEISHAASVLTNKTKKEAYDMKLQRPLGGHWTHHRTADSVRAGAAQGPRPTNGFQEFILTVFRPRNFVLGSIAIYTTVVTARHVLGLQPQQQQVLQHDKALVQAWKNPQTGEWEQPAPWDPAYRRLKPHLTMVPRNQVKIRHR